MRRVVITGAAGFTGYHVTKALLSKGYKVIAVVRPKSTHNIRLHNMAVKCIEMNILDIALLIRHIKKADAFIHLAWQGERHDFAAQYANVSIALQALEIAARMGCKRFLAAGSQAEYGYQTELITENTLPNPYCSYGGAKLATCYLTRNRATQLGIDWLWGRIFSLYGKYEPEGRLIPDLVHAMQHKTEFHMTSGMQSWDYLEERDAAEAIVGLLERGKAGEIYNIAHGDYHPLRYFTDQIASHYGADGCIHYGTDARQPISLQPSVEKIKRDTGWRPRVDFLQGIIDTYDNM